MIPTLSTAEFDALTAAEDRPVLVDFCAAWCAPCKALAPALEDMATDYAGEMAFCKIDIDATPELAERFGVRGVPTLLVLHRGQEQARSNGVMSRTRLDAFVDQQIALRP